MAGLNLSQQVQEEMYRRGIRQPSSPFIEDVAGVAEKAATGVKNIGKGLGDIAGDVTMKGLTALGVGAAGASDYFTGSNLMPGIGKEFEKSWGINNAESSNLPASAQGIVNEPVKATGNTVPTLTDTQIQKNRETEESNTLKMMGGETSFGGRGIAGTITDANGNITQVPKAPARDISSELDDLISQIEKNPSNIHSARFGGGLSGRAQKEIADLRKAQLGLEGHKEVSREATRERGELARERMDIMRQQLKQAEIAGLETRDLKKAMQDESVFQKNITTFGMDKTTGEFNPEKGAFIMGETGLHLDRPEVQRIYAPYIAQKTSLETKKGKKMSTADERKFRENYFFAKGWSIKE
jgi:hypothetical protein